MRVSTDEQDDQSQLRELRQYAKANGFTIVREVSEGESWSGADSERPQWLDIMERAESANRDFDFLLGCEYDRFGRNRHTREDINDLVDMGVNVIFIRDGLDTRDPNSELILDIKGNLSTGYRKSVSNHTRAKMLDRARQKLATGRPPFGYRIKVEGGHMESKHGVKRLVGAKRTYEIEPDSSAWVQKIFDWYIAGHGTVAIAALLNNADVPTTRGNGWKGSAVAAILDNPMFMGEWSYNRSKWVSRPRRERRAKALAQRGRRENDPREWVRLDAPELRIIEPDVWRQAKARRVMTKDRWHSQLKAPATAKNNAGRPSRQLFQLRCGVCGGSYIRLNRDKYGCSTRRESGGTRCTMNAYAHIPTTNAALVELVKQSALSPQMVSVFADEVAAESARSSAQPKATVANVKRAKEKADKKIANLVDAIATFGLREQPELHGQLKAATQERDAAVAELARLQSGGTGHAAETAQADDLRGMLDTLVAGNVSDPAVMVRARMLLAQLVDPFDAYPHPTGGTEFRAKLRRPLARRLGGPPPDFDVIRPNVVNVVAGA